MVFSARMQMSKAVSLGLGWAHAHPVPPLTTHSWPPVLLQSRAQPPLLSTVPAGQPQTPSLLLVEPVPVPPTQVPEQHCSDFLQGLPSALQASALASRP